MGARNTVRSRRAVKSKAKAGMPRGSQGDPAELITRLKDDVEELAAIDRRATRPGERRSAEWVASRLEEAGASDVRFQSGPAISSWAWAYLAHAGIALLGAAVGLLFAGRTGGLISATLALGAAISYEADYTGRRKWLRRLLPAGKTTNVVARIPARGPGRQTLVLVAHHDAAHTGWVFRPEALGLYRAIAKRSGKTPAYSTPVYLAMILCGLGAVAAPLAVAGAILLTLYGLLAIQAAASPTAPGANDNATGVAAVLELSRRIAASPLTGVELLIVSPGAEEVGVDGMTAWVRREGRHLDPETTLVLNLDSLGGGEPVVVERESWTARYRPEDLEWADAGAKLAGLAKPKRTSLGVNTDGMVARHAGLPAISILSMTDGWLGKFHQMDDLPVNVDWHSAARSTELAAGIVEVYAEGKQR